MTNQAVELDSSADNGEELFVVNVLEGRLKEALASIEKLVRKARRYGCPDISYSVGEPFESTERILDWDGEYRKITLTRVPVSITGEAPRVGNFQFLAKLTIGEGGNVIDSVPHLEVDLDTRFRHTDGTCEHCGTRRQRKEVFVVRNQESGEQVQVGRQCLRDFLAIDDPKNILYKFRFFSEVRESSGSWGSIPWAQSMEGLLSLAATCVRLFGWCSYKQAANDGDLTATASYVSTCITENRYLHKTEIEVKRHILESAQSSDSDLAKEVIDWVRSQDTDSDYMHNLSVIFSKDCLTEPKRLGLAISAISAYHKHQERELRLTKEYSIKKKSQHVGEEGERLRGIPVSLISKHVTGSNEFGTVVLHKFVDDDSNIYSWFTNTNTNLHNGERCIISATIKSHNVYQEIKENQVTRVLIKPADEKTG